MPLQEEAFHPYEPADSTTPGEGYRLLPVPAVLPHDLQVGQPLARWFSHPYNAWYVGKVIEINRRRTVSENVSAQFIDPESGIETWGSFVAERETYGASKLWVLLEPIPVDASDAESPEPPSDSDDS